MPKLCKALFVAAVLLASCGLRQDSAIHDIDLATEVTTIQNQMESNFCQSYALTALVEQRWYQRTGTNLKFSERAVIWANARTLAESYWNEGEKKFDATPFNFGLGNVGVSLGLKAVARYGLVPESEFPTTTIDSAGQQHFTFDLTKYEALAAMTSEELNRKAISLADVLNTIDDLFGVPPSFNISAQRLSYVTYEPETITLKSATDVRDFLQITSKDYAVVYSTEGFVDGMNIFNPEIKNLLLGSEERFTERPREMPAAKILSLAERMLDQGIPVLLWNKWQDVKNGVVKDSGGHITILIGYQTLPNNTRWYRVKNSRGISTQIADRSWPNAAHSIRTVNGFTYFERSVLEKALIGILTPAVIPSEI